MWVLKKVQNHYLGTRVFLLWKSTINVYFFMQLDFDELKWDLLFHFFCKITSKSYSTIQAFFGFSCRHLSSCCFDNKLISDYLQVFRQGYVMLQCAQIEHYTIRVKSYFSSSVKCILIAKLHKNLHFGTFYAWFFYLAAKVTKTNSRTWFEEYFSNIFNCHFLLQICGIEKEVNTMNTANMSNICL